MNEEKKEVLIDLLIKQATEGLTEAETSQLKDLEREAGRVDDQTFYMTTAAIGLVDSRSDEQLPPHLHARIVRDAEEFFAAREEASIPAPQRVYTLNRKITFWDRLGWGIAAAACIALAINIWLTRFQPRADEVTQVQTTPTPQLLLTPSLARERLLETAPDITRAPVAAGNVAALKDISGDIVWSDSKQAGYMRFRGLPPNDKNKETYQLWIFDETQDPKTPIDGGTFDVDQDGEVVIPIQARLKAVRPKAFAVTIEKPGGVVVSKQEKVVALAKTQA